MASGTARTTETTQIKTISTAVHFGTPIPLIRLQEATARYLKHKIELSIKLAEPVSLNYIVYFLSNKAITCILSSCSGYSWLKYPLLPVNT